MKKILGGLLNKILLFSFALIITGTVISSCVLQKQNDEKIFVEDSSIEKNSNEKVKSNKIQIKKFSLLQDDDIFHLYGYISNCILLKYSHNAIKIYQINKGHINSIYSPPELLS